MQARAAPISYDRYDDYFDYDSHDKLELYVKFAEQHTIDAGLYHQPRQGCDLNKGCSDNRYRQCKPACPPMFFCPESQCPPNAVRASGGKCLSHDGEVSDAVFS